MSKKSCVLGFVIGAVAIFTMSGEGRQAGREAQSEQETVEMLLKASDCSSCHSIDRKVVGPSYTEIARRYTPQAGAAENLVRSIRQGGSGNWGALRMPAHP